MSSQSLCFRRDCPASGVKQHYRQLVLDIDMRDEVHPLIVVDKRLIVEDRLDIIADLNGKRFGEQLLGEQLFEYDVLFKLQH